jgi:protocatechuate 3,4-dioxygenase beta subunit
MNVRSISSVMVFFLLALTLSARAGEICPPTQNDVEGPYYVPDSPFRTILADRDEPGEHIVIKGTVYSTDCTTPVKDALVEVWQTDASGKYHYRDEGYRLRGQMRTDEKGQYEFSTVQPGRYRIMNGFRPAHIHFKVSHRDYETLITQLYFQGDPFLWPKDACGRGCRSDDKKRIIELQPRKHDDTGYLKGAFPVFLKKRDT